MERPIPVKISPLNDTEFHEIVNSMIPQSDERIVLKNNLTKILQNFNIKRQSMVNKQTKIQKMKQLQANNIFYLQGKRESIDSLLQGPVKLVWSNALMNEFGLVAQGIHVIEGNDCIDFIDKNEVPSNKKVAYSNMVCDFCPLKTEKNRV